MMFMFKLLFSFAICILLQLIFTEGAWAWGPAIHTAVGVKILGEGAHLLPSVASIIQAFPLEYIYGSLSADFFVGKGQKKRDGHSHNWEVGFKILEEAVTDQESAYAYGFLSHLAADIIAHNYFVPNLLLKAPTWKRMRHLYCEARADYSVSPVYMRMARDVLSIEKLDCDELLRAGVGRNNGFKARKHLFTQSVKLSDFFNSANAMFLEDQTSRYLISYDYLVFMINLSYRLVKDFLTRPDSSPCLSYDPIGSRNLRVARRNGIISKIFNTPRAFSRFDVDQELLGL